MIITIFDKDGKPLNFSSGGGGNVSSKIMEDIIRQVQEALAGSGGGVELPPVTGTGDNLPFTISFQGNGHTGRSPFAARADHEHNLINPGTPGGDLAFGAHGVIGTSMTPARADHTHFLPNPPAGGGIHTDNSRVGAVAMFSITHQGATQNFSGFTWSTSGNSRNLLLPAGGTWAWQGFWLNWRFDHSNTKIIENQRAASGVSAGGTAILSDVIVSFGRTLVLNLIALRVA